MEWKISPAPVPYEEAVAFMEAHASAIRQQGAEEMVWLLEHPAIYTAGSSAKDDDLLDTLGFPVYASGRGGQYTYHGPGQRVAYVMLDLKKRGADVRRYVQNLERWIIETLAAFGVEGFIREGRVGVWVKTFIDSGGEVSPPLPFPLASRGRRAAPPAGTATKNLSEAKIAALGVRVRQWVSYHGIAINVDPDLSHYCGIVPCGISEYGVTSLAALGIDVNMQQLDAALVDSFGKIF